MNRAVDGGLPSRKRFVKIEKRHMSYLKMSISSN
jgi:hypothetical protein